MGLHKTLLLCFVHGFKGDENTFGGFREHLRTIVGNALPAITVKAVTYPQFETRGDLAECVSKFREWLQNIVIDLEVASSTPSPTIDPSVRTILIGHSMGGIVAADALLSILSETPIPYSSTTVPFPSSSSTTNSSTTSTSVPPAAHHSREGSPPHSFMFPYIQGIMAFDTPYLGISPGVLAHGVEGKYQSASSAYSALTSAASAFGFGGGGAAGTSASPKPATKGALPAGPEAAKEALAASADAAAVPAWQSWGRYAMFAGAAGAVAAGGAAAYLKRDTISSGWGWTTSHLEFVGALVKGEEMKTRMSSLAAARAERGLGFLDVYTVLGAAAAAAADKRGTSVAGGFVELGGTTPPPQQQHGAKRTFCNLPNRDDWKLLFDGAVNEKAADEVGAHMSMFLPRHNPGYYALCEKAKARLVEWVDEGWYESSEAVEGAAGSGALEESMQSLDGEEPVLVD